MDLLKAKINLIKDIEQQQTVSLDIVEHFKNCLETFLLHIQSTLNANIKKQRYFQTKIGLALHQNTLILLDNCIQQINTIFCNLQSVCLNITERQQCLKQIFKHGAPLFDQIESLKVFVHQTTLKYNTVHFTLSKEAQTLNLSQKRNQKYKNLEQKLSNEQKENINSKYIDMKRSQKVRFDILTISKQGKQNFLKGAQKIKHFQIMEFSYVIDDCLNSLSNFNFLIQKMSPYFSCSNYQKPSTKSGQKSLGIESNFKKQKQNEEVDLICNQDINLTLHIQKNCTSEGLQLIIEREQYSQSDHSPSRKTFQSFSPSP